MPSWEQGSADLQPALLAALGRPLAQHAAQDQALHVFQACQQRVVREPAVAVSKTYHKYYKCR